MAWRAAWRPTSFGSMIPSNTSSPMRRPGPQEPVWVSPFFSATAVM